MYSHLYKLPYNETSSEGAVSLDTEVVNPLVSFIKKKINASASANTIIAQKHQKERFDPCHNSKKDVPL